MALKTGFYIVGKLFFWQVVTSLSSYSMPDTISNSIKILDLSVTFSKASQGYTEYPETIFSSIKNFGETNSKEFQGYSKYL